MKAYLDRERRKDPNSLSFIKLEGDTVKITTKGKCDFRYGVKQEVKVNQSPLNRTERSTSA